MADRSLAMLNGRRAILQQTVLPTMHGGLGEHAYYTRNIVCCIPLGAGTCRW